MGIFSWFTRWREDTSGDGPALVYSNEDDDSDLEELRRDAAADIAAVEQDAKYFGSSAKADRDGGI
jgi:hypothetical protein